MADFNTRGSMYVHTYVCIYLFIYFELNWLQELISPKPFSTRWACTFQGLFPSLKAQLLFSFSQVQIH